MRPSPRWIAALAVLGIGASALAAAQDDVDARLRALAAASAQVAPLMRIGLEPAHAIRVASGRPFRIVHARDGSDVWQESYTGEVALVAEGGPLASAASVYRVQVGAFTTRAAADAERARLEGLYGAPAVVAFVPDRGSWRVRLGSASNREALGPLVDRLRAAGLTGIWITEEPPAGAGAQARLRLVDASFQSAIAGTDRLVVLPAAGARVEVEGKSYRGIVELRLSRFGTVRPVNWIGLESYLDGVVPAELGPEVWPQLEALKAQAVAARTYAWRNLGQFDEDGFDLCATPRCQVYGGASAEHPLSDRAVAGTAGEILAWEGKPISALYTATCGGHTEDGHEIFPEERAPYLVGVPCRAEGDAAVSATLQGRTIAPVIGETGEDFTRDWSVLVAAGVIREGTDPAAPLSAEDLRSWSAAVSRLAGRPAAAGATGDVATLAVAAEALVDAIGWSDRARLLLSEADPRAVLRDPEADALPDGQRRALACLVAQGALGPFPGGALGVTRGISRARAAAVLARAGDTYEALGIREAVVGDARSGSLRLVQGRGELRLTLAERPSLFSSIAGRTVPAPRLEVWSGDRVRFRTDAAGRIDFLELRPPVKGVADDRAAKVYSWEVRQTRREVEQAVDRRVDVGTLRDIEVVRRGRSGRIVELRVVGDRGATTVKGFDVRTLLSLRDSFAVIELQRDAAGAIEAVVFAGKGWGHGVGLCQVGAYGMALRGSTYREILAHYYRGARIEKIAPADR